ncbi:MBL fold metallo-hydrolase [Facklamia lactis]|uniref:MBL fold metallo-hydrolase n=1 Tax=Facklamia lactis TaxID=2749967 RepID=UPI0018CC8323|nr:MBL fold metallo-hydrolase [Facklamia lactis]MBG9979447.1 MBL fold metallo-hydrolase [Facklamia lactis]
MKKTKLNEVTQVSFLPWLFPINCYIIEEENDLTVVDIGVNQFVQEIKVMSEHCQKPVKNLIITHAHSDHVMGYPRFKETFPECRTYMSEREARFISEDFKFDESEVGFQLKGDYSKASSLHVEDFLQEGDQIGSFSVIETPGHSVGSISLWNPRTKLMIAGDAFQTKGRLAVSGDLVKTFPFPAIATASKEVSLQSAKKILSFNPRILAVGHGEMLIDPIDRMKEAISRCECERKDK